MQPPASRGFAVELRQEARQGEIARRTFGSPPIHCWLQSSGERLAMSNKHGDGLSWCERGPDERADHQIPDTQSLGDSASPARCRGQFWLMVYRFLPRDIAPMLPCSLGIPVRAGPGDSGTLGVAATHQTPPSDSSGSRARAGSRKQERVQLSEGLLAVRKLDRAQP